MCRTLRKRTMVSSQAGSPKRRKSGNARQEDAVISHAIAIRTLQRQEWLVEADRERLIDQHCSPSSVGVSYLCHRLGQLLQWTLAEARSTRTVLRLATQG